MSLRRALTALLLLIVAEPGYAVDFEPLGTPDLDAIEYPDDEEPETALVELGKVLFFDPRLSQGRNRSCASCHNPDLGFGDGTRFSTGTMGERLDRNSPPLYNLAWNVVFFWDGRARTLEEQVLGPLSAHTEMNMPMGELLARLELVPFYRDVFRELFPDTGITGNNLSAAIAAFERTIITRDAPFDRYLQGDSTALGPEAVRGLELFRGRANCVACHDGPNFTDNSFHNIGIDNGDPGRARIQTGVTLSGAFKTPGLRNAVLTAPYMHDGSIATLEEVVRYYDKGGHLAKDIDPLVKPLQLSEQDVIDLVAFLAALTEVIEIERPAIP